MNDQNTPVTTTKPLAVQRQNSFTQASFIIGICALVAAFIPGLGCMFFPAAATGFVLGILALTGASSENRSRATAGVAMCGLAMAISMGLTVVTNALTEEPTPPRVSHTAAPVKAAPAKRNTFDQSVDDLMQSEVPFFRVHYVGPSEGNRSGSYLWRMDGMELRAFASSNGEPIRFIQVNADFQDEENLIFTVAIAARTVALLNGHHEKDAISDDLQRIGSWVAKDKALGTLVIDKVSITVEPPPESSGYKASLLLRPVGKE